LFRQSKGEGRWTQKEEGGAGRVFLNSTQGGKKKGEGMGESSVRCRGGKKETEKRKRRDEELARSRLFRKGRGPPFGWEKREWGESPGQRKKKKGEKQRIAFLTATANRRKRRKKKKRQLPSLLEKEGGRRLSKSKKKKKRNGADCGATLRREKKKKGKRQEI